MAAELIIAPEAQQDVDEAYGWYEDRRPGLGEEFLGFRFKRTMVRFRRTSILHPKIDFSMAAIRSRII